GRCQSFTGRLFNLVNLVGRALARAWSCQLKIKLSRFLGFKNQFFKHGSTQVRVEMVPHLGPEMVGGHCIGRLHLRFGSRHGFGKRAMLTPPSVISSSRDRMSFTSCFGNGSSCSSMPNSPRTTSIPGWPNCF